MIINKVPRDIANAEIENGEVVLSNTGKTFLASGDRHSKGGTPVFLEDQTRILSKKLKADKDVVKNLADIDKEMSYADLGKKYMTDNELRTLNDKKADKLELETAQLMLTKKLAQLDSIFNAQEVRKQEDNDMSLNSILSGLGGSESVFKDGGRKLPKYQRAGFKPRQRSLYSIPGFDTVDYTDTELLLADQPFIKDNLVGKWLNNDTRVGQYQKAEVGWDDKTKTYLTTPDAIGLRRDFVRHLWDDKSTDWKKNTVYDDKGNLLMKNGVKMVQELPTTGDFRLEERTNIRGEKAPFNVDYINRDNQTKHYVDRSKSFIQSSSDINKGSVPMLPTRNVQEVGVLPNVPLKPLSSLTKPKLPSLSPITNPEKPIDAGGDYLKEIYQMNALRDGLDLATLNVRPPEYNYKPQQVAYQRFLPMNTLAQERQFNLQKEQIENSNLPEQVKSAYVNDMYAKLQEGISDVQVRNYQNKQQLDNNNVSLYNQTANSNINNRTNYDDKFNELNDRVLFNYSQEKLRLQDKLMNTYAKYKENQFKKNMVNQMSDNYMFDGSGIVYKEGSKPKVRENPMGQYNQDQLQDYISKILQDPTTDNKDKVELLKILKK